jgi:hypothetical protein
VAVLAIGGQIEIVVPILYISWYGCKTIEEIETYLRFKHGKTRHSRKTLFRLNETGTYSSMIYF